VWVRGETLVEKGQKVVVCSTVETSTVTQAGRSEIFICSFKAVGSEKKFLILALMYIKLKAKIFSNKAKLLFRDSSVSGLFSHSNSLS